MWQRNLGILVNLENVEWKVYLKRLQNDPYPVFRDGWGADYPDPDNFMKLFTSGSGNNHSRWKNSRYDQILDQAAQEARDERRARLYDDAQKLLCETDIAIVPLFVRVESTLLNPRFVGLEYSSMGRLILKNVRMKQADGAPPAARAKDA
jgi:oligopeptide transport system substrate-binding protein